MNSKINCPISFKNVSFSYDKTSVLSNVSFQVEPNEFIGIIGPNGGGKTTALKLILGLLSPTKGEIKLFEKSPELSRTHVGYVPQNMQFDRAFPITVLDLVLMGNLSSLSFFGRYKKDAIDKALQALETVGLIDFKDNHFNSLSGGQLQKALLARAIICDPKLLILDEPTANIDPGAEDHIFSLLAELQRDMTILLVSHNFSKTLQNVDRILCFQKEVSSLKPTEVCEHFALGLYHTPLPLDKKT